MPKSGKTKTKAKTPRKKSSSDKAASKPVRREVGAAVCLFLGLFSIIGFFPVEGVFIQAFSNFIKGLIGWGYYLFPPALFVCAWILFFHKGRPVTFRLVSVLLLPLLLGMLIHQFAKTDALFVGKFGETVKNLYSTGKEVHSGGFIAGYFGQGFKKLFSVYGAVPLLIVGFFAFVVTGLKINVKEMVQKFKDRPRAEYVPEPEPEVQPMAADKRPVMTQPAPVPADSGSARDRRRRNKDKIDIPLDGEPPVPDEYAENRIGLFNAKPRVKTPDQVYAEQEKASVSPAAAVVPTPAPAAAQTIGNQTEHFTYTPSGLPVNPPEPAKARSTGIAPGTARPSDGLPFAPAEQESAVSEPVMAPVTAPAPAPVPAVPETAEPPKPASPAAKIKSEDVAAETESITKEIEQEMKEERPAYEFPSLQLLASGKQNTTDSSSEIALNRERLETTIHSFGVSASISGVTRGPTVTRYDLELDAGVKLNKLTNLSNDLALSLGVSSVRIAPIPDKISTVGIEVPNKMVSTVCLRDILASREFQGAASKLSFAIGKDIGGNAIVGNISKLPHLLIAGTTGSGKSVCMNSLILSLLYKATPEEVRLIMVDPKMVELGIYNGIPHLYIPVVTDPKKAAGALQWSVVEMMKRYRLFSEAGVRDLSGYNAYQKRIGEEILPQVVIVIDELADLMLVASKEVEESICRVAQMGRASGMHLIIATQRPSADVITGLMKANIPSRIAFAVSSAMESRIILDAQGAEKLIGQGDMLYAPLGAGKPLRVQGAFVSDEEREEVIRFVKSGTEANYSDDILQQIELAAENSGKNGGKNGGKNAPAETEAAGGDYDELLPQAVEVILETKQASVSMLQRRLKLGYSRAARLVDQMEELGVVGPFEGSKPRALLITREQWQEMQMRSGGGAPEPAPEVFAPDMYTDPEEETDVF